jgi:hypothetical protein
VRSDAGSRNPTAAGVLVGVLLGACSGGGSDAPRAPEEKISRTDSVKISPKAQAATNAAPPGASFCEKLYKPGEKPFKAPAERPISGVKPPPPPHRRLDVRQPLGHLVQAVRRGDGSLRSLG